MSQLRQSLRLPRAPLSQSYAPCQPLRPRFSPQRLQHSQRCMSDFLPKEKPDPMKEWRNPAPSKWPNRIRFLMLPFVGAIIYSMVCLRSVHTLDKLS
jgi:coproporphyrinogen III oxidase